MRSLPQKLLAATLLVAVGPLAACSQDAGTSVRVALAYDDALGLDTAEVTLGNRTQSARISHQLLLLVPDELADAEMPIAVWGKKAGRRSAYGTGSAVPVRGKTVATSLALSACTPSCQGNVFMTCTGPAVTCVLGCIDVQEAHCVPFKPSNGVDPTTADSLSGTTTISADTLFNTSTGEIVGGLSRAAGTGTDSSIGIGYVQADASGSGGAQLGIFVFHDLIIEAGVTVHFTGARAAVLLVGNAAKIAGAIDVAATHMKPGPGGGAGGSEIGPAQGCGAGEPGAMSPDMQSHSGGGGAGGSLPGGPGGDTPPVAGGGGGPQCMPASLVPLQGGSGGGRGSSASATSAAPGGPGGGALQISALGSLEITGKINAGGGGGIGGATGAPNTNSGGGAGGGGGLLLESPKVTVAATASLTANGGGGGGGGGSGVVSGLGDNGHDSPDPAAGGAGGGSGNSGGTGGAQNPPDTGNAGQANGGGGGGGGAAAGVIAIRGLSRTISGSISPDANQFSIAP